MLHDCLVQLVCLVAVQAPAFPQRGVMAMENPRSFVMPVNRSSMSSMAASSEHRKKVVRIMDDFVDVRYFEVESYDRGDVLVLGAPTNDEPDMDDNRGDDLVILTSDETLMGDDIGPAIDNGDKIVFLNHGDTLDIDDALSDDGSQKDDDLGDTFVLDHRLFGDRLELPKPVHQLVVQSSVSYEQTSTVMSVNDQSQAVYHQQCVSMHRCSSMMFVSNQESTTLQCQYVVDTESHIRFRKLASHLGGLSFDYTIYQRDFGVIKPESPYGDRVWRGMVEKVGVYPFMHKVWGSHPWLCYFITPEKFSKLTAGCPVSTMVNRGTEFTEENSYPAIVYLNGQQHDYLMSLAALCRPGKHQSDCDYFNGLQFDGRTAIDSTAIVRASPGISNIVQYNPMMLAEVDMLCLKILIAGCRPWRVHSSWLQLYMPVSYSRL